MSEQMADIANGRNTQTWHIVAKGVTGLLAIFVAIQAMVYSSSSGDGIAYQDHIIRLVAFCSLAVWTAFTIGLRRRGMAVILTLAFASLVDLLIVPARAEPMGTLVSANLGIVIAYCGLQLYWNQLKLRAAAAE